MKSTLNFILSLIFKLIVFALVMYLVMSALGVKLDDVKKLFPTTTSSAVYADEISDETVCVFYDGDEIVAVKAIPEGMAFAPPIPSKSGYIFLGWKLGETLCSDEIIPNGKSMFFQAAYKPIEYTVYYYNLDGSLVGCYTVTVESDLSSIHPAELDGKDFDCWINIFDFSEEITSDYVISKDLMLLPKYKDSVRPFFLTVWIAALWNWEVPVIFKILVLVAVGLLVFFAVRYIVIGIDKLVKFLYKRYLGYCFIRCNKISAAGKQPSEFLRHKASLYYSAFSEDCDADDSDD